MNPLNNLRRLSQSEIVARWGLDGTVGEAYEKEVGPYEVLILFLSYNQCWSAYWGYRENIVSNTPHLTVEEALQSLIESALLRQKELEKEVDYLQELRGFLEDRDRKSALERLADEPI